MEYKGWGNLNKEEEINSERRKFLKKSALGFFGVVASVKALDKVLDFFSQDVDDENEKKADDINNNNENIKEELDKNEIEIKKPRTKKSQKISDVIKPEKSLSKGRQENLVEKILNAEEMAEEVLRVYNSPALLRRFDESIFTKDFFIAQQFQESRGDYTAESSAGARGVYQNKPESVIDVVRFLALLREKTKDLPRGERCDYVGQDDISEEDAKKISALFLKKADYGRAVGKLYLLSIHDKDSKWNNDPNPDVFRSKSPKKQQELLLLSYHDGPSRRRNPQNASQDAKKYLNLVERHMRVIVDIRSRLEKAEMSKDLDYAILKILQKLDNRESRNKTEEVISYWLQKLQKRHINKWKQDNNFGQPLNNNEIRSLFIEK